MYVFTLRPSFRYENSTADRLSGKIALISCKRHRQIRITPNYFRFRCADCREK